MANPIFQYETRMGEPFTASGRRITLFSKALVLRIPGMHGGLIWNRPASVLVADQDGQEQVIPVVDATRMAILGLLGASLAWALVTGLMIMLIKRGKSNRFETQEETNG